jgi:hypothetical protein
LNGCDAARLPARLGSNPFGPTNDTSKGPSYWAFVLVPAIAVLGTNRHRLLSGGLPTSTNCTSYPLHRVHRLWRRRSSGDSVLHAFSSHRLPYAEIGCRRPTILTGLGQAAMIWSA